MNIEAESSKYDPSKREFRIRHKDVSMSNSRKSDREEDKEKIRDREADRRGQEDLQVEK